MEPSCLAVFKDELPKILPHDDDAARLTRSACHFGEFFQKSGITPPPMAGRALLWGHCHHRATGGVSSEQQVLQQMGLEVESLTGGCCGLAGSWGFEQGKYRISLDCGEQALLPAVRKAGRDTLVVASGFSCQTQIEHARTGRRALHLGQVMQLARQQADGGTRRAARRVAARPRPPLRRRAARLAAAGTAAAAAVVTARAAMGGQR